MRFGQHVRTAIGNSSWLITEHVITLGVGLFVSVWLARYLGPESFGALSYSSAFVALLAVIHYLGFAGVVVQELVKDSDKRSEIMGTVLGLKLAAAVVAVLLANLIAAFVVDDPSVRFLILLISVSMLFDVSTASRLAFEAQTLLRPVAVVAVGANLAGAAIRVLAIAMGAPLWVFAALVTVQSALAALGYGWMYRRHSSGGLRLNFNAERAKRLLHKSWPLIISSAGAIIYLKIDQLMLGEMAGMEAVGTYAVAARLSEVWYFLPTGIAAAIFPRLLALRRSDPEAYQQRLLDSTRFLFWLSLAIAIPVTFAAPQIITVLYGEEFRAAGVILAIHVWACPAVFMGKAMQKWFIAEDLLKHLVARQLVGAALNVGLNLVLIPEWGGVGAAIATVVAYTYANYFSCFTSAKTAPAGFLMTRAMFWPLLRLMGSAKTR